MQRVVHTLQKIYNSHPPLVALALDDDNKI